MHAEMRLQFTLDIPDNKLDVSNPGFLDILCNIVALKTVLQISLLNQEYNLNWRKGSRRSEVFDARK